MIKIHFFAVMQILETGHCPQNCCHDQEENRKSIDAQKLNEVYEEKLKAEEALEQLMERWAELAAKCPVPICAIGGIDAARARELRATGHCDGVAVVSAICAADDTEQAARDLV